jgi:hypothetical protein
MKWLALALCAGALVACGEDADPFDGTAGMDGTWSPSSCPEVTGPPAVSTTEGVVFPDAVTYAPLGIIGDDYPDDGSTYQANVAVGGVVYMWDDMGNGLVIPGIDPAPGECIGVEYTFTAGDLSEVGRVIVVGRNE